MRRNHRHKQRRGGGTRKELKTLQESSAHPPFWLAPLPLRREPALFLLSARASPTTVRADPEARAGGLARSRRARTLRLRRGRNSASTRSASLRHPGNAVSATPLSRLTRALFCPLLARASLLQCGAAGQSPATWKRLPVQSHLLQLRHLA